MRWGICCGLGVRRRAPRRAGDDAVDLPGIQVLGELGRGAQSVVYRVRRDGSDFAAKILLSRVGSPAGAASVLFRREAALLAWVNHPGLAAVHEVGEAAGRPYLVMASMIDGDDLAVLVRQGPLPPQRVVELGVQIGDALAAVHRAGLIHRDVKPANVIVQPDGRARLIDLGLAGRHRAARRQQRRRWRRGGGHLAYAARSSPVRSIDQWTPAPTCTRLL